MGFIVAYITLYDELVSDSFNAHLLLGCIYRIFALSVYVRGSGWGGKMHIYYRQHFGRLKSRIRQQTCYYVSTVEHGIKCLACLNYDHKALPHITFLRSLTAIHRH